MPRCAAALDGRRSLDDLVLQMIAATPPGSAGRRGRLESRCVRQALGSRGVAQFHAMMSGKLVVPAVRCVRLLLRAHDRAPAALPARLRQPGAHGALHESVRGLIAGAAAARAGLRNGDRIVKPVPQDSIQADQAATLTLLIERNGRTFPITYLPRGATVPAYQWRRRPGIPDARLRSVRADAGSRKVQMPALLRPLALRRHGATVITD